MGSIFKIAVRNILRHKKRTLLTGIIITFGFAIYLFFDSMYTGMDRSAIENMINLTVSSVKIHTKDYDADKKAVPLKYGLADYQALESFALKEPGVAGVTRRTQFLGELTVREKSLHVLGTVIDPDKDETVFSLTNAVREGRFFSENSENELIIGKKLADDLNLKVGDSVIMQASTRYETQNALDFTITGLIDSSNPELNENGAIITYKSAAAFLDLEGLTTEADIHVNWPKGESVEKYIASVSIIRDRINRNFGGDIAYTFRDLSGGYLEIIKSKSITTTILSFLILLIAAVGIVNSVLMSVYERVREIGILKALGLQKGDILRMFLYEGVLTGAVGSIMGLALGILLNIWLVNFGINFAGVFKDSVSVGSFPVWGIFYGQWNIGSYIFCLILGIALSVAASIVPARKAADFEVTKCLRFV